MPDSYPASIAEYKTEQSLPHIVTSFEMVRVEDLNRMITVLRPCALAATRTSTKDKCCQKPKGYRCLRMRTDPRLVNFLNGDLLPYPKTTTQAGLILIPWLPAYSDP